MRLLCFGATLTLLWGLVCTNKTLHVMHLAQRAGHYNFRAIADYAFDLANKREDLLPGYTIQSHSTEIVGENIGQSTQGFVEHISQSPVKIAILGPLYTSQSKVVAATAKYYNILQVSYMATSPVMTNTKLYPYFARTIESSSLHNPAIMKILDLYNWKKIATIAQSSEYIVGARDQLQAELTENNITILASATYSQDPSSQITQLKESKAKILISFTGAYNGMRPFCRAYKEKLYGARYQWLHWDAYTGLTSQFSDERKFKDDCTSHQVREAAEGVITFNPKDISEQEKREVRSNSTLFTADELLQDYHSYLDQSEEYQNTSDRVFMGLLFEAAWTLALAFNDSVQTLEDMGESLEDFTYQKPNVTRVLFDSLLRQQYYGPTGPIRFDKNGDRISNIVIRQVRGGKLFKLGEYDPVADTVIWEPHSSIWFHGTRAPFDWDITIYKQVGIDFKLSILMITLAFAGLLYCIFCVSVTFKYRNFKLIKLSSPRINFLIALGCGFSYLDILFFGLDSLGVERQAWMCGLRVWLLLAGFTLAFGSMFSKTWRVHILFTNKKLQRKIVKDFHLFSFVLVILLVDFLLLGIWQVVDPLKWSVEYLQQETSAEEPGKIIQPMMYMCSSKYMSYWSGSLYAFKGLLLIFGIFFAWETRKVRIEALNDSKLIGISVYNVMIMSVITVPLVSLLSPEQASIKFGITSISILVCATLTMSLVYGMKIYLLFMHGNKVDDVAAVQLPFQSTLKHQNSLNQSQEEPNHAGLRAGAIGAKSFSHPTEVD